MQLEAGSRVMQGKGKREEGKTRALELPSLES